MSSNPSRYRDTGIEGEWQPGSRKRVLRNLQNIRMKTQMDQVEADALEAVENSYFDIITDETVFTATLICQMHKDWLADLMFLQAGYPMPLYSFSGKGAVKRKKAYLNAVVSGYGQNYEPLAGFFAACVEARLRELEE